MLQKINIPIKMKIALLLADYVYYDKNISMFINLLSRFLLITVYYYTWNIKLNAINHLIRIK